MKLKILRRVGNHGRRYAKEISKAREGQGKYRELLLEQCHFCLITMISDERLLIASHIKPWAASSDDEKIDPYNKKKHGGLLLMLIKPYKLFLEFEWCGKISVKYMMFFTVAYAVSENILFFSLYIHFQPLFVVFCTFALLERLIIQGF